MKLGATLARIPAKARLVLISLVGISIGFLFLFFKMVSSPTPTIAVDDKNSSKSSIPINLDSSKIDKARPDQAITLPSESEASKEISRINAQDKDEAVKTGNSFVDSLHLNNEKIIVKKIDDELNKKEVHNGIDDVINSQKEAELKRREALIKKREEIVANNRGISPQQAPRQSLEPQLVFDEDSFLEKEVKSQQFKPDGMKTYIKEDASHSHAVSEYKDYSIGTSTKDGAKGGSTVYGGGAPNYYAGAGSSGVAKSVTNGVGYNGNPTERNNAQSSYKDLVSPTSTMETPKAQYITAGTMYYSILEIGINTDELSPVRATVVQEGPLKGAVLIGEPTRVGEKSVIKFSTMAVNGKDYSVSVVALDPDTMRTGLADDVDNHTFERYFKLAAASIVSGYAEALTGETTTNDPSGGSTTIKAALPKGSDQIAAAIGNVGTVLAPKFEKEFDRAPTITVNGNRDLGIMFMSGVQL